MIFGLLIYSQIQLSKDIKEMDKIISDYEKNLNKYPLFFKGTSKEKWMNLVCKNDS